MRAYNSKYVRAADRYESADTSKIWKMVCRIYLGMKKLRWIAKQENKKVLLTILLKRSLRKNKK